MPMESLFERVGAAVSSPKEEEGLKTLAASLEAHMTRLFGRMRRLGVGNMALILVYLALYSSAAEETVLLGLTIKDPRILRDVLPAFVALVGVETVIAFIHYRAVRAAHDRAVRLLYPALGETRLHRLLRPSTTHLLTQIPWPADRPRSKLQTAMWRLSVLEDLVQILLVVSFLAWSCIWVDPRDGVIAGIARGSVVVCTIYSAVVCLAARRGGLLARDEEN